MEEVVTTAKALGDSLLTESPKSSLKQGDLFQSGLDEGGCHQANCGGFGRPQLCGISASADGRPWRDSRAEQNPIPLVSLYLFSLTSPWDIGVSI